MPQTEGYSQLELDFLRETAPWFSRTMRSDGTMEKGNSGSLVEEILWAIKAHQHLEFGSMTRIVRCTDDAPTWEVWATYDDYGRKVVKVAFCGPGGKVYTI